MMVLEPRDLALVLYNKSSLSSSYNNAFVIVIAMFIVIHTHIYIYIILYEFICFI